MGQAAGEADFGGGRGEGIKNSVFGQTKFNVWIRHPTKTLST